MCNHLWIMIQLESEELNTNGNLIKNYYIINYLKLTAERTHWDLLRRDTGHHCNKTNTIIL